jgi:hypothetical protein
MSFRTLGYACLLGLLAPCAQAVNDPPLAEAWNIRAAGIASSSGDIVLRVTPPDGSDPVEITVPVLSGDTDQEVARSIRRALNTQLRSDQFNVSVGEGANVLVTSPRSRAIFGVGLVTSDVDNMRVFVNSTPPAGPAVPVQSMPADAQMPAPATAAPQGVVPPSGSIRPPQPATQTPQPSTPLPKQSVPTPQPSIRAPGPSTPTPANSQQPPNTGRPQE